MNDISSKLTIKTLEQCQWQCSGGYIVKLEQISHIHCSGVSIVGFKQEVNAVWE